MESIPEERLATIGAAKALALGAYGEDMAAYRYLLLAEKADRDKDREEFREMVAEEQGHRDRLQTLLDKHFPGADFVLSSEEKQMVESGARGFAITDRKSFEEAVRSVVTFERMTAEFYERMEPHVTQPEIKAIFRELAHEGVEHHRRLRQIAIENNIDPDE